jgi:hypothetical protein
VVGEKVRADRVRDRAAAEVIELVVLGAAADCESRAIVTARYSAELGKPFRRRHSAERLTYGAVEP